MRRLKESRMGERLRSEPQKSRLWSWVCCAMESGFGEVTGSLRDGFFHSKVRAWRVSLGPDGPGVLCPAAS